MVSESLRAVVSQRLVARADGGRVPALEMLVGDKAVGNLIRENKTFQVRSRAADRRQLGMRLARRLARRAGASQGGITREEAARNAEDPSTIPRFGRAARARLLAPQRRA